MTGEPLGLDPVQHPCALHRDHGSARPLVIHVHHIQPEAAGGPDNAGNRANICPNAHASVHHLMGCLVYERPLPQRTNRLELAMAREGIRRWIAAGRPGNPQAFWG